MSLRNVIDFQIHYTDLSCIGWISRGLYWYGFSCLMFLWKGKKNIDMEVTDQLIISPMIWCPISLNCNNCILKDWCWGVAGGYRSADYKYYDLGGADWWCRVISFSHVVQWIWNFLFLVGLASVCIWHLDLDYDGSVNFLTGMIELGVVGWLMT